MRGGGGEQKQKPVDLRIGSPVLNLSSFRFWCSDFGKIPSLFDLQSHLLLSGNSFLVVFLPQLSQINTRDSGTR